MFGNWSTELRNFSFGHVYDFLGLVDFIDGAEIGMDSLAISIGNLMGFNRSGKK